MREQRFGIEVIQARIALPAAQDAAIGCVNGKHGIKYFRQSLVTESRGQRLDVLMLVDLFRHEGPTDHYFKLGRNLGRHQ